MYGNIRPKLGLCKFLEKYCSSPKKGLYFSFIRFRMRLSTHETTSNTDGKAREPGIELGKTGHWHRRNHEPKQELPPNQ